MRPRGPRGRAAAWAWLWLAAVACDRHPPPAPGGGPDEGEGGEGEGEGEPDTGDGRLSDPLSMPLTPTHSVDDFHVASACVECHPAQVADWAGSGHAYAMIDPVFRAAVGLRQAERDGAEDPFCLQCHSAIGTRGGEIVPGFSFDDLSPVVLEGVTCEACHKVESIERLHNAGHVLDPGGPIRGPLSDPAGNSAHASAQSALFSGAELCGSCHDLLEVNGLPLERPYAEWETSPAATAERPCQDCHMPRSSGAAAEGGPARELHSHRFIGPSVPLQDGSIDEAELAERRALSRGLLEGAVTLGLAAPTAPVAGERLDVVVTVQSELDAHNFPTGSTFNRQAWLELEAVDGAGARLYITGDLDENGDLRDAWSALDPYGDGDLLRFSSSLLDVTGAPTFLPWHATEHVTSSLQPLQARSFTLFVPVPEGAVGPIVLTARVRYREYGPFLLRALGLDEHIDQLEITDIDSARLELPLP